MCQAWIGNTMYTGCYTGEIITWNGKAAGAKVKAHTGKCTAIFASTAGDSIISGGSDGKIILWSVGGALK